MWAGVTVFMPLINNGLSISTDVFITGVQRYIYIIVLMFPFEIRDLRFDSLKLSTIPQRIGIINTKIIGTILLIILFVLEFFKDELPIKRLMILSIVIMSTLLALLFSKIEQGKYYSAFLG